jgi:hypothetical protein
MSRLKEPIDAKRGAINLAYRHWTASGEALADKLLADGRINVGLERPRWFDEEARRSTPSKSQNRRTDRLSATTSFVNDMADKVSATPSRRGRDRRRGLAISF